MTQIDRTMSLVRRAVDERISQAIAERRDEWSDAGPAAAELLDAAADLLGGGKRMRAVLAAIALSATADSARREDVLSGRACAGLGAALELYQASALIHDDVIDGALTRRGLPAAHRRFATAHRGSHWLGDAEAHGRSAAILLGDLLLSAAGSELGAALAQCPQGTRAAGRAAFDAMAEEVALGQYLDVRTESLPLPDEGADHAAAGRAMEEAALAVVRRKSARYSVMHPLLIGALLGGLPPHGEGARRLAELGEATGIAFQLRDDELGVFGDPARTGKPAGDDLREGKRTVLLALAWQRCDAGGRAILRRVLANTRADPAEIAAAAAIIEECGARAAHEERIDEHAERARRALEALITAEAGLSRSATADLASVISLLTDRSA
ncbi:polyprenyl synthetase family protein [Actinomyces gaoshouyii]|uniref:Geranylgeranyl pyrophosphate synthase n=1 Tax=Actinomyces gaoshouyii TaxID=1960083 RepID=A0A8H9H9S1_9ACTO|nr:polyprenyl synthetase family protein [Actinomyces gaoshouyii]GGO97470.1 geranylgeranyl pyrophosphate synthase [Actinomyces gaoshouyii]